MKHPLTVIALIALSSVVLSSCSSKDIYSAYQSVNPFGWSADSLLEYPFSIEDTSSLFNILINVRHTDAYPYQNMWLFVKLEQSMADSTVTRTDTIEFYLADDRGQWFCKNRNGLMEMPVLYEEQYRFPHTGDYKITIQQGMREEQLRGIHDVGIEIAHIENK